MPKPRSIRDARYNAKSSKHYGFKLNVKTDAELIEKLETVGNINGYIRRLIREDIERSQYEIPQQVTPSNDWHDASDFVKDMEELRACLESD